MQGNSFLGAFFRVSPFLKHFGITDETFLGTVKKQYEKKFGRFGEAVVTLNMFVMEQGFSRVQEIKSGDFDVFDRSTMCNALVCFVGDILMIFIVGCGTGGVCGMYFIPFFVVQTLCYSFQTLTKFDSEYRNKLNYHQPTDALTSVNVINTGS